MKFCRKYAKAAVMTFMLCSAWGTASAESLDMTLADGVQMALERNCDIEESAAELDSAYWALREARRQTGPKLSWNMDADAVGGKAYEGWGHKYFANQGALSMPIYSGGRLQNNIKAAQMSLSGAELTLERTRQSIRDTVAQDYYDILRCRSQMGVYEESVGNLKAHLDNVNSKYEAGTVAMADVLSSEVSLAQGRQKLVSATNAYKVAVATFNKEVGLPAETETRALDNLTYQPFNRELTECEAYALLHRPDLFQKEYNLLSNKASMEAAKSGYRPSVDASASRSIAGDGPFKSNLDSSDSWTAGISVKWNIFDNQVTQAQVKQRAAAVHRAEAELRDQLSDVKLEVRNAYTNLRAAEENIHIMAEVVGKAEEDYNIEEARYLAGVGTNLELMDAQNKLVEAKGQYINALYSYNSYKSSLEKAMGVKVEVDVEPYRQALEEKNVKGDKK